MNNVLILGEELSERVLGAFIVKQSKRREPHATIYDHDEISHVLLVEYKVFQDGSNKMYINGNSLNTVNIILQKFKCTTKLINNNINYTIYFYLEIQCCINMVFWNWKSK